VKSPDVATLVRVTYRLIIFDLDGTLVTTKSGDQFRRHADDWQWLPGRLAVIAALRGAGIEMAIATNQGGVAFGIYPHEAMRSAVESAAYEAKIWTVYSNFTHPKATIATYRSESVNRKPGPGMLYHAMNTFHVPPARTLMVGDRDEDRQAAARARCDFQDATRFFAQFNEEARHETAHGA